ncbi:MAG: DUF72 domain-containing protein [Desulfobacterales bacterium]|nr:DUF72 domain-containing protein [Desulfobacterales bacterium]
MTGAKAHTLPGFPQPQAPPPLDLAPLDCQLHVGTSGYSYGEWLDSGFYPPDTHSANMLARYAEQFNTIELNYTWYQMPKATAMDRMSQKVPRGFGFTAKLTRTLTHEVRPDRWKTQAADFRRGIAPLVAREQLRALLVQLPPYFHRTRANRIYLAALLDELAPLPLAVEFRHRSWVCDRVFAELERRNTALVAVDVPDLPDLFPAMARVTHTDFFYIRFHGRNARGWQSGNMQEQFDYNYGPEELESWQGKIQEEMAPRARTGLIFFNNHVRGQAPSNARALIQLFKA